MAGVNKVLLVGYLANNPTLRYATTGNAIVIARLATDERRKNEEGEYVQHTEYHRLIFFGKTAETINRYCKMGKMLYIEGRNQTKSWIDKESGKKKYMHETIVSHMQMIGPSSAPHVVEGSADEHQQDEDDIPID